MSRTKRVEFGFTAFGETRYPVFLAQRFHLVTAAGKNFMRITLVAHVPDQLVHGGVEHRMNSHRKLHNTEA